MYPHRIRLRGPWEFSDDSPSVHVLRRVTIPAGRADLGCLAGPHSGTFTRRFGLPRTLDSYERVWLTCAGATDRSRWMLNGETVAEWHPPKSSDEIEVTGKLLQRNVLQVHVESATSDGGLWGEVALEIRGSHFLRGVAIHEKKVAGLVVGAPEAPLELYVLRYGKTVRYEGVTASAKGEPFSFGLTDEGIQVAVNPATPPWSVELVEGANRWFTVELPDS